MGARAWQVKPTKMKASRLLLAFWFAHNQGASVLDAAAFAGHFAERLMDATHSSRRSALYVLFARAKRHGFAYPNHANHVETFRRHADWWIRSIRRWPAGAAPFIATINDNPMHAAPYLVFSDWLEERGDRRAELIRVLFQPSQGA